MRNNNQEGTGKRHGFALGALVMLIFALVFTTSAFAAIKLTDPLDSYDDGSLRWENSNITMWLNSDPQPFVVKLGFDGTEVVDACGPGTSTPWAGTVQFGLGHTDTNDAQGFQSTDTWWTIDCTGFAAGQTTKKYPTDEWLIECVPEVVDGIIGDCELVSADVVTLCPTGNCTDAIVTSIQGNLDSDCNGAIDDQDIANLVAADNLCFYWEAVKPPKPGPSDPHWTGNLQVRIQGDAGGDKTLNFNDLLGPNAITLSRMGVSSAADLQVSIIIALLALIVIASVAAGLLQRWQSRAR